MALDEEIVSDLHSALLRHIRSRQRGNITLTYGELIASTGRSLTERGIGRHLTRIGDTCEQMGQPRLDYLVVKQSTGRPGIAFDPSRWMEEIERCRKYPWPV